VLVIVIVALSVPLTVSIPRRTLLCLSADIVPVVVGHFGARSFGDGNHMESFGRKFSKGEELRSI
jgi:hypothetical protein